MMRYRGLIGLVVAVLFGCAADVARAQSVAYFRHDQGVAMADDESLPGELASEHQVWQTPLPAGHSTPLVVDDRIYLTGHEDLDLWTICLDRKTGDVLWKQSVHVEQLEPIHAEGSPAAATPACDGQRVFSFFGSYGLVCYRLDGTPAWTKEMGPFRDEFGSPSSPIVFDGKVVLCEDHDLDSFLIAVDAEDGDTLWQTPRDGFTRSYATPVLWRVGGRPQIVMAGALQLVAYDPANGQPLWSRDGLARIVNSTPVEADGTLFVNAWSPGGDTDARIAMEPWSLALDMWDQNKNQRLEKTELPAGEVQSRFFRIDLDSNQALDEAEWNKYARIFELAQNAIVALEPGQGGQPPRQLWEYRRGLPYVPSPLVYRGHVFLIKDGGILTQLNARTGKLEKQLRARGDGAYYASPAGGDGKVYAPSKAGVVTVFSADAPTEIVGSRDFGERIAASPVIDRGRVYIRTEKALYAFGKP